jgi:signal peptidase II
MISPGRLRAYGFALALVVFALDRAIKWYVSGPLQLQYVRVIELFPFFALRWTENYGISLGLFTATSSEMRLGLLALTGAIALGVAVWMWREKAWGDVAGLAFVLGGALGNIVDRFTRGYVIDYADLHFGEWRPFLIFNLADAAITVGVLILLARSLLSREKPTQVAEAPEAPAPENV